ncbi:MAG: ribbon-helix-helix protein, CopG family [Deltaproteobacteria bacterium]|nr:ribbon-helix-helix protein, CopG family [Deltaproteobacteria bacterium]
MGAAKAKISITISEDLLDRVDSEVERSDGASRSSVIEAWLRSASRASAATILREETIRYYEESSAEERLEEEALGRATSKNARRVNYD